MVAAAAAAAADKVVLLPGTAAATPGHTLFTSPQAFGWRKEVINQDVEQGIYSLKEHYAKVRLPCDFLIEKNL